MKQLFSILIILILTSTSGADTNSLLKKLEIETDQKISRAIIDTLFFIKNRHRDQKLTNGSFLMFAPSVSQEEWVDVKNKFIKAQLSDEAIDIYKGKFKEDTFGSGFLYRGYVITNFHVCRGKNSMARDPQGKIIALKVVDFDVAQDICLLKSEFAVNNYQDFSTLVKNREIATATTDKKDKYKIHSMFGVIEASNLVPDNKEDNFTKLNGYVLTNNGKECRGGISGAAVEGPNGFFGIIWGALASDEPFSKTSDCYLIEKKSIDDLIAKNN